MLQTGLYLFNVVEIMMQDKGKFLGKVSGREIGTLG